jgi:hypothetical protein
MLNARDASYWPRAVRSLTFTFPPAQRGTSSSPRLILTTQRLLPSTKSSSGSTQRVQRRPTCRWPPNCPSTATYLSSSPYVFQLPCLCDMSLINGLDLYHGRLRRPAKARLRGCSLLDFPTSLHSSSALPLSCSTTLRPRYARAATEAKMRECNSDSPHPHV